MVSSSSQRNFRSLLSTFRSPSYKSAQIPEENDDFEGTPTKKAYREGSLLPNFEEFQRQPQIPNAEIDVFDDDTPLDAFGMAATAYQCCCYPDSGIS
ncbi:TPA_exp: Uncharacterized protein A8136_7216 [Trichophyton benhamiae CBS 112371]|uniref:Uncharacterized protein n=1 Tax=Arthroderma benhamiae (strain ATCC MYA-4681 / CBS 112371) TaxID=663331 RepID=D4AT95_ARTBC|nr:uncharacterized protein ARB_07459 [Trichophyton benhamiae CBS 112371]EFE33514.1 hypothetical protein ARB_07459 [Trichophyton benhamiae CBS 112371]DAA76539.1 TPA_exp: Uncharacterized protein A8136_7216 [Trichophyton benhamiae CBS 112371]